MGKAFADASPVARAVFEEVDDALGEKLSDLMFDGDIERVAMTTIFPSDDGWRAQKPHLLNW